MLELKSVTRVAGLRGREITDFLTGCDDETFQRWWPGTHLRMYTISGEPGRIGSVTFIDEMIGPRRIRTRVELVELDPGKRLVWQVRRPLFRLPVKMIFDLEDDDTGVHIEHLLMAGFAGTGSVIDPLFRLVLTPAFAADKDDHVRTEFARLRAFLHGDGHAGPSSG